MVAIQTNRFTGNVSLIRCLSTETHPKKGKSRFSHVKPCYGVKPMARYFNDFCAGANQM